MKNTIYINLFGGPGVGKSTIAAETFSLLKKKGYNAELITEYAKELTWQEHYNVLENQVYVMAKQMNRQKKCMGKVDVAITDSPILLSAVYGGFGCTESFNPWLKEMYGLFNNLNIFLNRDLDRPYQVEGRSQSLYEAQAVDVKVRRVLEEFVGLDGFYSLPSNDTTAGDIIYMYEFLKQRQENGSIPN